MSTKENIPEIKITLMPAKYFIMHIDGVEYWNMRGSKLAMKNYLKKKYDIDLRTDPRIIRNYTEFTTRKVSEINGVKTYRKTKLSLQNTIIV